MEYSTSTGRFSFPVWKKFLFISIFFLITPIALTTSLISLFTLQKENPKAETKQVISENHSNSGVQVYASLPANVPSVSGSVLGADARGEMVRQYLAQYDSPLEPYSDFIVQMADKYGLDYRLLTAIARKESGLGKRIPSSDCLNGWGWGIHSAGTLCFDTWEEGIETVSKGLKENYIDQGLVTPVDIMSKYNPGSPDGIWAEDVQYYLDQMR